MKYKLVKKTVIAGVVLYRVEALRDFGSVKKGDIGGYVESEENLSQTGFAWVSENAKVYGNARVYGNGRVGGDAMVFGDARVYDDAYVFGNARVYGNAYVFGHAHLYGDALVYGTAMVYGGEWVSTGRERGKDESRKASL